MRSIISPFSRIGGPYGSLLQDWGLNEVNLGSLICPVSWVVWASGGRPFSRNVGYKVVIPDPGL
jgi:hypothetical protein